ncbi:MAG: hypothetical protein K2X47_02230, partial [Bdellovibrionales bacterium]|nr:hypothetical protein [Bdellovibrionales bacterium]
AGQNAVGKTSKKVKPKKPSTTTPATATPKKKSTSASPPKSSTGSPPVLEKTAPPLNPEELSQEGAPQSEGSERHESRDRYGIAASILSNDMAGTYSYSSKNYTATMSGRGFGLVGFYDHFFSGPFSGRLMVGLEQFSATVNQYSLTCDGGKSTICSIDLTNLSVYAQGRVTVNPGKLPIWVAGGIGGWVPLAKKSTVFDSSSIGPLLVFVLSAGVDVPLFGQKFPIFADYVYLSGTATVAGSSLIGRIGYSWR